MTWRVERTEAGAHVLDNGQFQYPLTPEELEVFKTGTRAEAKELAKKLAQVDLGNNDLDGIRASVGGAPYQKHPSIAR